MKNMKKLLAMLVAVIMIAATVAAMADATLTPHSPISVTGLEAGDTVKYYKVVEWKNNDWALTEEYATGLSTDAAAVLAAIKAGNITVDIANKIGAIGATAVTDTKTTPDASGKWESSAVEAGLYMVAITAGKSGTIYNPVFLAANYIDATVTPIKDSANTIAMSESLGYSDTGMAKKSTITLDKTTSGTDETTGQSGDTNPAYTTDNNETVSFTVTTTIPLYGDNYTKPQFRVKDKLNGLAIVGNITVTAGSVGYKVTPTSTDGATEYTVEFNSDAIKAMTTAQAVEITYSAKVTDQAALTVNQEDNTVTVEYSNGPEDETGAGRLKDKTNHFTFSIDTGVKGLEEETSTEVIKVGRDSDNKPIESVVKYSYSKTEHPALNGAEFKLYTDQACTQEYSNDVFQNPITTSNNGRLQIKGLDAGNYWLKETNAPAGYIKVNDPIPVVITATISTENVTEMEDGVEVTYITNKLDSYSVSVGGTTTSYTIHNSKSIVNSVTRSGSDAEIVDTKGVELPSTGGVGTTIFYIGGSILVLAAVILLVTKRRMSSNE